MGKKIIDSNSQIPRREIFIDPGGSSHHTTRTPPVVRHPLLPSRHHGLVTFRAIDQEGLAAHNHDRVPEVEPPRHIALNWPGLESSNTVPLLPDLSTGSCSCNTKLFTPPAVNKERKF
jgi:hypothetical protein